MSKKQKNNEMLHKISVLSINLWLEQNFVYGIYTFKQTKWTKENVLQVVDFDGKKAKIVYDFENDIVHLL